MESLIVFYTFGSIVWISACLLTCWFIEELFEFFYGISNPHRG